MHDRADSNNELWRIPVTRVHVTYRPVHAWRPPPNLAVTVRGALGSALFDIACVRPHRECRGCDLAEDCAIPTWFRVGGQSPPPYALRVAAEPARTQRLRVELVFFGVIPRPSLLTEALVRVGRLGLGSDRVGHVLERLDVEGEGAPSVIVAEDRVMGIWPRPARLGAWARLPQAPSRMVVDLLTPLQTADNHRPTPASLVQAALLRIRAVARACGTPMERWRWPDPGGLRLEHSALEWVGASRYSRVSRGTHDLSGWVGRLEIGGEVEPFVDLLVAAEVLHVGRGAGAGLGRISLDFPGCPRA